MAHFKKKIEPKLSLLITYCPYEVTTYLVSQCQCLCLLDSLARY